MTAVQPASHSAAPQQFTAAVAARDVDALVDTLAPEPVLHSPITGAPFEGRQMLADLYASLFESFEDLRVIDEFSNGDIYAFFWEGHVEGRYVFGADHLRLDAEGKVREITVVGRPLSGLSTFLTGVGFRFARRRRGRVVAGLLRLSAMPLALLFSLVDPVTRWLQRRDRA